MTDLFKALSEESRLRIISVLLHTDLCVCEIVECLQLKQSNISRHLAALKNSGILDSYKKAQWIYYKIDDEFRDDNELLWRYLEEKLKEMPSYQGDYSRLQSCKLENICNTENADGILNKSRTVKVTHY